MQQGRRQAVNDQVPLGWGAVPNGPLVGEFSLRQLYSSLAAGVECLYAPEDLKYFITLQMDACLYP